MNCLTLNPGTYDTESLKSRDGHGFVAQLSYCPVTRHFDRHARQSALDRVPKGHSTNRSIAP